MFLEKSLRIFYFVLISYYSLFSRLCFLNIVIYSIQWFYCIHISQKCEQGIKWRYEFHCFHTFLVLTSFVYEYICKYMFSIFFFHFAGLIFWNNFTFLILFFFKLLYLIIYLIIYLFDNKLLIINNNNK